MRRLAAAFLIAGLAVQAAHAVGPAKEPDRLFFVLEATPRVSWWVPGIDSPVVRYRADALTTYEGSAAVGFGENEFGRVSCERPFTPSVRQQDMLASRESGKAGLEKYTAGFDLRPIIAHFFPAIEERPFLRTLLSVEFFHSRSAFYGRAQAKAPFFYLPNSAAIDWSAMSVSGAQKIPSGSAIEFRIRFEENEITLALLKLRRYTFRAGYYDLSWERPADAAGYSIVSSGTEYPVISDARYETKGLTLALKNDVPSNAGFNGDIGMRFGLRNKIKAALERRLGENQSLAFFSLSGGAWYNWYVRPSQRGLFFTLGGTADLRNWRVDTKDAEGRTSNAEGVDAEQLFSGWVSAGWRF